MDFQQAITQGIRTAAQAIAGLVAVLLVDRLGIGIDEVAFELVLAGLLSGLYAVITTWLAKNVHPIFGYLSILPSTPKYGNVIEVTGGPAGPGPR